MRTYLADIIPRIKKYSEKLDNLTLLTNQHWVVIDELKTSKYVYIFRKNSQLLIAQNGKVEKGRWEYLGNNSLLIERGDETYLFRHGFFDANILALKVDGTDEYAFLVNENNYGGELNSVEKVLGFLEMKYLQMIPLNQIDLHPDNIDYSHEPKALNLTKDLNPVENDEWKYGYMDKNGKLLVDYKYDGASDFSEGRAVVYKEGSNTDRYGYLNESGEEVVSLIYEFGESFSEGLALVRNNGKFGYIDFNGEIKIPIKFDSADSFQFGKAKVKLKGHQFYIDQEGNKI